MPLCFGIPTRFTFASLGYPTHTDFQGRLLQLRVIQADATRFALGSPGLLWLESKEGALHTLDYEATEPKVDSLSHLFTSGQTSLMLSTGTNVCSPTLYKTLASHDAVGTRRVQSGRAANGTPCSDVFLTH